jgi:putative phosphoesterase
MQQIALLSDTHNYLDPGLFKYLDSCDQIWHAGDIGTISVCEELRKIKPLVAVYGNIDGMDIRKEYPENQEFSCEEVRVFMTHIGGYPDHYPSPLRAKLETTKPNLFICGHSHILRVIYDKKLNLLHINPGAAGMHGFHQVKTLVRFSLSEGNITDLEVIELGSR